MMAMLRLLKDSGNVRKECHIHLPRVLDRWLKCNYFRGGHWGRSQSLHVLCITKTHEPHYPVSLCHRARFPMGIQ